MYGFKQAPKLITKGYYMNDNGEHKLCIMELVDLVDRNTYEQATEMPIFMDRPDCVDPLIAHVFRTINDTLPDERRQELLQFFDRLFHAGIHPRDEARRKAFSDKLDEIAEDYRKYLPEGLEETFSTSATLKGAAFDADPDEKLKLAEKLLAAVEEIKGITEVVPKNREKIEEALERFGLL